MPYEYSAASAGLIYYVCLLSLSLRTMFAVSIEHLHEASPCRSSGFWLGLQTADIEKRFNKKDIKMFWGLIMEPNKRYSQVVETSFHISQAALDISTGDAEPCQVMIVIDNKNFLACTLQKNKNIQVPLDYNFKAGSTVAFLTNGKCNVHLTGYLDEFDYGDEEEADDEEDDEEEEETSSAAPQPAGGKRKMELSNELSSNKKAKHEQKVEKNGKAKSKLPAGQESSSDSDDDDDNDDDDNLEKLLNGDDLSTDENDDSFKMNMSTESTTATEGDEDSDEDDSEDDEDESPKKKKKPSSESADTSLDTSLDSSKIDMSKMTKSQKRRLKKKLQKQGKEQQNAQVNGVEKQKKQKEQQKPEKEKKKQDKNENATESGDKKEKKVLSGGVAIEDLKVGSGPVAKSGKVVMVYYEGRLKQNNKVFDQCNKGPGFKFRLGSKEVINGWDIGIAGMKVGGKRKIVCPPAMSYGAKGNPPVIPPNSTLVFEVELKNVK